MKAAERREQILQYMKQSSEPISASALAAKLQVSRQIIVGDVAILRAAGEDITATPRGYVLTTSVQPNGIVRRVACVHTAEQMEEELNICVDYGCTVMDVIVDHPVYGEIIGPLQVSSRFDVAQFVEKIREQQAHSLLELTDGVHLHTLLCPSEEIFDKVHQKLEQAGFLVQ